MSISRRVMRGTSWWEAFRLGSCWIINENAVGSCGQSSVHGLVLGSIWGPVALPGSPIAGHVPLVLELAFDSWGDPLPSLGAQPRTPSPGLFLSWPSGQLVHKETEFLTASPLVSRCEVRCHGVGPAVPDGVWLECDAASC